MSLFDQIIFGPIQSRRLGTSLGVNLLPIDAKICSYNCIYCECGFNTTMQQALIPGREQVYGILEAKLSDMQSKGEHLDVITFAGNGEPTLHKEFAVIIYDTIALREQYYPDVKVSVLPNSNRTNSPVVFYALLIADNNIF